MTTALSDDLLSQLQGGPLQQMSQQLGIEPAQASAAIGAALPLLLGALGRNTAQPQGAQALFGALQKDHAGLDIGSVLGSVLGGGGQGGEILGHIFGGRQPRARTRPWPGDRTGWRQGRHAVAIAGADRDGVPGQTHVWTTPVGCHGG